MLRGSSSEEGRESLSGGLFLRGKEGFSLEGGDQGFLFGGGGRRRRSVYLR